MLKIWNVALDAISNSDEDIYKHSALFMWENPYTWLSVWL